MMAFLQRMQSMLDATRKADFLGPLTLRLYLVPVFWVAGTNKLAGEGADGIVSANVIAWFGNTDWGLGLPFPTVMAFCAVGAEVFGAISLLLGLGVRWFAIPMMITMLVAMFKVHWENGWPIPARRHRGRHTAAGHGEAIASGTRQLRLADGIRQFRYFE